ncbi:MAG: glycosyltransferase, partial [Anaerolineales bacterium]|nr:glycosyltransferase [Anaerolineales bacterium]
MKIGFLNPQGNFDPNDSYWTEHPDFGGQLVYVKELASAMAEQGHKVDIITRWVMDPQWPEFQQLIDGYPEMPNVRILRLPCGPPGFLAKEKLWPHLGKDWVPNILKFYADEGGLPAAFTAHYADGGLVGALIAHKTKKSFTFTGHSLGAQKMDKLGVNQANLAMQDTRYHFTQRIMAERISMNHAGRVITSTRQERLEQYGHPAYRGAIEPQDEKRFAVIPPGVNQRIFSTQSHALDEQIAQRIAAALLRDVPVERH